MNDAESPEAKPDRRLGTGDTEVTGQSQTGTIPESRTVDGRDRRQWTVVYGPDRVGGRIQPLAPARFVELSLYERDVCTHVATRAEGLSVPADQYTPGARLLDPFQRLDQPISGPCGERVALFRIVERADHDPIRPVDS